MGENSKIGWTHHTFNPWIGCTKVSDGCDHCYAESLSKRTGLVIWGQGQERHVTSADYWKQPTRWYKAARAAGERHRVFSASLADIFDKEAPIETRRRFWDVVTMTSGYLEGLEHGGLDYLLLTKRPGRILEVMNEDGLPYDFFVTRGCWLGTTIENKAALPRIASLTGVASRVHFLSMEPQLEDTPIPAHYLEHRDLQNHSLDWVIDGGESGANARPMRLEWAYNNMDACQKAGVAFYFKQTGAVLARQLGLKDKAGADPDEWPEPLRVQQFPKVMYSAPLHQFQGGIQ
jgi:protein gp37